jgi:hypothetical protein
MSETHRHSGRRGITDNFAACVDAPTTVPMSDRLTAVLGRQPVGPGVDRQPYWPRQHGRAALSG